MFVSDVKIKLNNGDFTSKAFLKGNSDEKENTVICRLHSEIPINLYPPKSRTCLRNIRNYLAVLFSPKQF
jgi:hypothetical protein